MTWLVGIARSYWRPIGLLLLIQIVSAVMAGVLPYLMQRIIALAIEQQPLVSRLLPVLGQICALYLLGALFQGIGGRIAAKVSSDLLAHLQRAFFDKLAQLPLHFFQCRSAGEFFVKFNNDLGHAQRFIASFIPGALREVVTSAVVLTVLFAGCPAVLTLLSLLVVLISSLLSLRLNSALDRFARAQRTGWSEINRLFEETVQGIDTLKTFAAERARGERFAAQTADFRDLSVRASSYVAFFSPLINLVTRFGGLFIVFAAYYMISEQKMNIEPFLLFFFYERMLQSSLGFFVGSLMTIQPKLVGIRNVESFFSEHDEDDEDDPEQDAAGGPARRLDAPVSISFEDIRFRYPDCPDLYQDLSLHAPARCITLLHGPSGSGKSTLINLLLGFYRPTAGRIRLGDAAVDSYRRKELRSNISVVTQLHQLFNETLRDNMLLAKQDATDQEILTALQRAHLADFLQRQPGGLDTVLDPRGRGMSGGERQRICIARLLLRGSPLMVLDEPWSNLDPEARDVMAEVLNALKESTTILILSHVGIPSLKVDRVYHLKDGRAVEAGSEPSSPRVTRSGIA